MARGGDTRAAAAARGKKVGRPPKPKIELSASKGTASRVLASIDEVAYWRALLRADLADGMGLHLEDLDLGEKRLIEETLEYLTNRRDGKPAQGVFQGDTRETAPAITRGNSASYFETENPAGADKPN